MRKKNVEDLGRFSFITNLSTKTKTKMIGFIILAIKIAYFKPDFKEKDFHETGYITILSSLINNLMIYVIILSHNMV